ncbi:regulator of nonsense transcripts 1 [Octopus bimaculoides]|uniref:EF-hand domain-containing protein n=1 Tax=Octopus bimaculoides TaxID=37653 RepID=A0A0L8GFG2_OCTBM|nr:regulator of nonsense transcripts 1 [Octopus bimaculoides]XP_014781481.1 regulator of nonsense transcripts 1 [Octopus bimaculoides]XP_014781482.1 regulator of nonsense transcripts 1 [Octopus bimaculoides]|eukprot:XP_014781480.1 PREDICTED: regulator of nonsense transcripts 1-like [Octopus bimaculoides]
MIIQVDSILFGVLLYCSCWVHVFSHINQGYPPGVPPSTGVPQQMQYQQQPPQYQQAPGNQQYQQPPGNQQYQQPPSGNQQYQQPPSGNQQYQQPPSNQQHQQHPPGNQQYQQQQQPPPQGSHGHGHGHGHNFKEESHDQAHIAEHLKDYAHKPVDQMTNEEMEFHYFKLHDYDDNNKLDGNEITSAITHFQREDHQDANEAAARTMSDTEISDIVDMVLKEDDLNNDGYVEYSEFATAQRRAKANMAKNEAHK